MNTAHSNTGTVTAGGETLPALSIHGDPTFIVSTALATRDFQDVHHDRDLAQQKGSKDIFVNILTDTGLVQRYVTDWAGPPRGDQVDLVAARRPPLVRARHAGADRHRRLGRRRFDHPGHRGQQQPR